MRLFGLIHLSLLSLIVALSVVLSVLVRRGVIPSKAVRWVLGYGLAVNELIWWWFRYSHEGFRFPVNLPLQLCDATVWAAVLACLTLWGPIVEFAYFAGIAGAGTALITPDLWSPWPAYPAIYFFLAHGGIVIAAAVLVFGRVFPLRHGAMWRAFGILLAFAAFDGVFDAIFTTNYMYLRQKPGSASLLDQMGPWPIYLMGGLGLALVMFWLLWLAGRQKQNQGRTGIFVFW